jgi:hypothetical protein
MKLSLTHLDSELTDTARTAKDNHPFVKLSMLSFLWETHAHPINQSQARCLILINYYLVISMNRAYQDSNTNASSFFQGYIIRLEKS